MRPLLLLIPALLPLAAQSPCSSQDHRLLDFMLGEWATPTGHSRFRLAAHGCAIVQDLLLNDGTEGKGLIYFEKAWQSVLVTPTNISELTQEPTQDAAGGFSYRGESYRKAAFPSPPANPKSLCPKNEFGFWEGKWDVFSPRGVQTGTNHIYRAASGCVLVENWTASGLTTGISLNFWDPNRSKWRQIWVAPGGNLHLEGNWEGGVMRLASPNRTRLSFTPNLDGTVRQYWEQSTDGGKTWAAAFDGTYKRAQEPGREKLISDLTDTLHRLDKHAVSASFPSLIAAEKYFQAQAESPAGDNGFDPGYVEPFLTALANHPAWKPPAGAEGGPAEFRALRARTIEIARTTPNLRANRRPFGPLQTNLDTYQWLALAARYSARNLPSPLRTWTGTWRGEGTFQGKPATVVATIKSLFSNKFDELSITVTSSGMAPFEGRAVYDPTATAAHWNDSMGNAYAVRGEWHGDTLTALWADPVRGRSTYHVDEQGVMKITDEVRRPDGTFSRFANYELRRDR